ncbi:MAG: hypothetical protein ACTHLR_15010 [Rhizomicrobium sp.]
MLLPAFYILTAAVLIGLGLALFHLGILPWRSWMVGLIHALLALTGLVLLIAALGGPARGAEYGVQSFGLIATALGYIAFAIGLVVAGLQILAKKSVGWLIGAHVTLGIAAYFILMTYVAFG